MYINVFMLIVVFGKVVDVIFLKLVDFVMECLSIF